jgi:hypothetical protein
MIDGVARFWISKYETDEKLSPITETNDSEALALEPTTELSHESFQFDVHPQNKFPEGLSSVYFV